jgi:hypothetical protein
MGLRFKRNSVDKKSIRENNRLIGRHRRRWKWTTMSWIRGSHNSDWWIEKEGFWLVVREKVRKRLLVNKGKEKVFGENEGWRRRTRPLRSPKGCTPCLVCPFVSLAGCWRTIRYLILLFILGSIFFTFLLLTNLIFVFKYT